MVVVAQLVRAPDCGSGGRGFESHHPPYKEKSWFGSFFLIYKSWYRLLLKRSFGKNPGNLEILL